MKGNKCMIDNELISIIVPVYNSEVYLKKCLDSLINQTYKNIEIVIVDDGSSDNSNNICNQYAKKNTKISITRTENHGVSHARNIGIDKCKGKYIVFVDSDDYISNDMIEKLHNVVVKEKADIAMCDIVKVDEKYNQIFETKNKDKKILSNSEYMYNIFDFDYSYGYPINKIYIKELFKKVKFNENVHFMEDFTFVCDIINNSKKIVYIPDKMYYYLQRKDSAIHSNFNEKWLSRIDTQKYIIDNYLGMFSEKCKHLFLYDYIMMILSTYAYKKTMNFQVKKNEYYSEIKKYYTMLLKSKYLNFYSKIKLLLKYWLPCKYFKFMNKR